MKIANGHDLHRGKQFCSFFVFGYSTSIFLEQVNRLNFILPIRISVKFTGWSGCLFELVESNNSIFRSLLSLAVACVCASLFFRPPSFSPFENQT
jgi:hypothetical protein